MDKLANLLRSNEFLIGLILDFTPLSKLLIFGNEGIMIAEANFCFPDYYTVLYVR